MIKTNKTIVAINIQSIFQINRHMCLSAYGTCCVKLKTLKFDRNFRSKVY